MKKIAKSAIIVALMLYLLMSIFANRAMAAELEAKVETGTKTAEGTPVTITFSSFSEITNEDLIKRWSDAGWTINKNVLTKIVPSDVHTEYLEYTSLDGEGNTISHEVAKVALPYEIDKVSGISIILGNQVSDYQLKSSDVAILETKEGKNILSAVSVGDTELYGKYNGQSYTWKVIVTDSSNPNPTPSPNPTPDPSPAPDPAPVDGEFELVNGEIITIGDNEKAVEIGRSFGPDLKLLNKSTNEMIDINSNNLKLEVSNKYVAENTGIKAKAIREGVVTLKYTYTYNNKEYTYSSEYFVFDPNDGFDTGEYIIPNTTSVDLKVGKDTANISLTKLTIGSYAVVYPDEYTADTYYKYEWSANSNTAAGEIIKIEKISDTEVKITPLKAGLTDVVCTISTADGKQKFTKTIWVTVADENSGNTGNGSGNNSGSDNGNSGDKKDEKLPDEHAKAGENGLTIVVGVMSIIIAVSALVKSRKYKKIK